MDGRYETSNLAGGWLAVYDYGLVVSFVACDNTLRRGRRGCVYQSRRWASCTIYISTCYNHNVQCFQQAHPSACLNVIGVSFNHESHIHFLHLQFQQTTTSTLSLQINSSPSPPPSSPSPLSSPDSDSHPTPPTSSPSPATPLPSPHPAQTAPSPPPATSV